MDINQKIKDLGGEEYEEYQKRHIKNFPNHPLSDLTKFKLDSEILIETGTCYGHTVQRALDSGFKKIYTVEADKSLYEMVKERFKTEIENGTVVLYHNFSSEILPKILEEINEPVTFWLDAHLHNDNNGVVHNAPILEELDIITKHKINSHLIMVDDMRIIRSTGWGRGSMESSVIEKINVINKNYEITYRGANTPDDVLIAKIK